MHHCQALLLQVAMYRSSRQWHCGCCSTIHQLVFPAVSLMSSEQQTKWWINLNSSCLVKFFAYCILLSFRSVTCKFVLYGSKFCGYSSIKVITKTGHLKSSVDSHYVDCEGVKQWPRYPQTSSQDIAIFKLSFVEEYLIYKWPSREVKICKKLCLTRPILARYGDDLYISVLVLFSVLSKDIG